MHGERRAAIEVSGETAFPFILQNLSPLFLLHRDRIFVAFLCTTRGAPSIFPRQFGIGVGTLVMLVDVIVLLTIYSLLVPLAAQPGGRQTRLLFLRHTWGAAAFGVEGRDKLTNTTCSGVGEHDFRRASPTFTSAWWLPAR